MSVNINEVTLTRRNFAKGIAAAGAMLMMGEASTLLSGCASKSQNSSKTNTHTVTDVMGRQVEIPDNITKVIAIPWPWSSFLFAIDGSAEKIASMSATALASYKSCMFEVLAPGLADSDTSFIDDGNKEGGSFGTLNVEEIARITPDFVIIYKRDANAMLDSLESVGITTLVLDYGDLDLMQDGLLILGQAMGQEDAKRAQQIVDWQNEASELVDERIATLADDEKPSAIMLRDGNLNLYNTDFSNNMFREAGASVATDSLDQQGSTSGSAVDFEQIQQWDPDFIFLGNFAKHEPAEIYNNTMAGMNWSNLKAVKNKHVYKVPMGLYRWDPPSTEAHLALLWEAKIFHPELFSDIDLIERTKEFYRSLFSHELTQDEIDMIFHNDLNDGSENLWS